MIAHQPARRQSMICKAPDSMSFRKAARMARQAVPSILLLRHIILDDTARDNREVDVAMYVNLFELRFDFKMPRKRQYDWSSVIYITS